MQPVRIAGGLLVSLMDGSQPVRTYGQLLSIPEQDGGDPPGAGASYYTVRAAGAVLPKGSSWREALGPAMQQPDSVPRDARSQRPAARAG